jgi:hypothetical protein
MRASLRGAMVNEQGYNAGNARSAQKAGQEIGDAGHFADCDRDPRLCPGTLLAQYSLEIALSGG